LVQCHGWAPSGIVKHDSFHAWLELACQLAVRRSRASTEGSAKSGNAKVSLVVKASEWVYAEEQCIIIGSVSFVSSKDCSCLEGREIRPYGAVCNHFFCLVSLINASGNACNAAGEK
jgi:hypothetical protein